MDSRRHSGGVLEVMITTGPGPGLGLGPVMVGHVNEVWAQSWAVTAAKLVVQLGGREEVAGGVVGEANERAVVKEKLIHGFFKGRDY